MYTLAEENMCFSTNTFCAEIDLLHICVQCAFDGLCVRQTSRRYCFALHTTDSFMTKTKCAKMGYTVLSPIFCRSECHTCLMLVFWHDSCLWVRKNAGTTAGTRKINFLSKERRNIFFAHLCICGCHVKKIHDAKRFNVKVNILRWFPSCKTIWGL